MNHLKMYIADTLSLLRVLATLFVICFALAGMWTTAFVFLIFGWGTDLLDGLAARRYGSLRDSHPNFDADGLADSALAFGASLVPVGYAIHRTGWLSAPSITLMTAFVATVVSGVWMVSVMGKPASRLKKAVVAVNMIAMHGAVQIVAVVIWFAFMAYGIGPVLGIVIGSLVAVVPATQERKLKMWWTGRLS
jgi:phosphatidylglycerophosphate synthase